VLGELIKMSFGRQSHVVSCHVKALNLRVHLIGLQLDRCST